MGIAETMKHAILPDNLPSIAHAKLPGTYESARSALAKCSRIDECADWANKAEALASYAKQAGDDTMRKMADRIQARAIRRCGEMLRAIKRPEQGGRPSGNGVGGGPVSRAQAARDAGLSRGQKRDAIRVARVPEDEFEAAVESNDPPTVSKLAERGREPRPGFNIGGRDPEEFSCSTQAQGQLRRFAEFTDEVAPAVVVRGAVPREYQAMARHATQILSWLTDLLREIDKGTR